MEEAGIVDLLWNRMETAIDVLSETFGKRLFRMAENILGSREDAQECVNDTYLALWNAIPPARPESLAAFVFRTGRSIALNQLRRNTAQKRGGGGYTLSLDELADCIFGGSLPEERWNTKLLGQTIDRFLDTVSRENRVIFLRRYWFGDSIKDLAVCTGLTESAVSVRLNRIRDKLKKYLITEGYFHEA